MYGICFDVKACMYIIFAPDNVSVHVDLLWIYR